MTVFGSKELKAYVILLWSGAVPRGGGGGGGGEGGTGLYIWLQYMCAYISYSERTLPIVPKKKIQSAFGY